MINSNEFTATNKKRNLVTKIEKANENIKDSTKNLAKVAIIVGIAALGTYYFGNEILSTYLNDASITQQSSLVSQFNQAGVIASGASLIAGIGGAIVCIKSRMEALRNIKTSKEELNNIEGGRTL